MSIFSLRSSESELHFAHENDRLCLIGMTRAGKAYLYQDSACHTEGPGPVGNFLTAVVRRDRTADVHEMNSFEVTYLDHGEGHLSTRLRHETLPLELVVEIKLAGNVSTWRGQVCWSGDTTVEIDIYFPFLSRLCVSDPGSDRAILPRMSGSVLQPTGRLNEGSLHNAYIGGMASPVFLIEDGTRGIAFLDDNRADFAAEPGACVRRTLVVGNDPAVLTGAIVGMPVMAVGGDAGPFAGVCHTRVFKPVQEVNVENDLPEQGPEGLASPHWSGEYADLGPVSVHIYHGTWRTGADWLRRQRSHVPFRRSPAAWYRRNTFISEHWADSMAREGRSFYDFPKLLAGKEHLGSDFFHIYGYHDPAVLGTADNWANRGDYFLAAQNLGGFTGARDGIEAVHRQGGRVIYYVEGLIVWKASRLGISKGGEWALQEADGSYTEHYQGYWHMCPACEAWQDWLAETCATIIKTTGVDGFFIDSLCATYNHRCYNPGHRHPHPDIWNWGIRRLFAKVRAAIDRVSPESVLFTEGCADLAREFVDGFIVHSHDWTGYTFTVPFLRYLHPEIRAYESWGRSAISPPVPLAELHLRNFVNGLRIYAHEPDREDMAELGRRARMYHDSYPEICDSPISEREVAADDCLAELFLGPSTQVLTVGNPTGERVEAGLTLPVPAGLFFDRVDGLCLPVIGNRAELKLGPWEFRAFEVRA